MSTHSFRRRTLGLSCVGFAVLLGCVGLMRAADAQVVIGGHTLTDWNAPAVPIAPALPVAPGIPVAPALPVTPTRPVWNPWYQPNVIVVPTYNSYFAPPTRWDAGNWDGEQREAPAPPPKPKPTPRPGPQIMQWNAATGRAEPVQVNRWDGSGDGSGETKDKATEEADPSVTAPSPDHSEESSTLNRWDK